MREGVSRGRGVATRNAMVTFMARGVAEQFETLAIACVGVAEQFETPMIGRVGVAEQFGDAGDRLRRGRGAIWDASEHLRRGRGNAQSSRNDASAVFTHRPKKHIDDLFGTCRIVVQTHFADTRTAHGRTARAFFASAIVDEFVFVKRVHTVAVVVRANVNRMDAFLVHTCEPIGTGLRHAERSLSIARVVVRRRLARDGARLPRVFFRE